MSKHNQPTQHRVGRLAAAGMIAGSMALTLAPAAQAAPDSDWDRLAQCESGGNWAIDTGNGFQGGLQFSPSTWTGFGGGEFAPTANQASREQQIVVAERVLASQGWGAWPSCSSQLGLNSGATQRSATPAAPPAQAPAAPAAQVAQPEQAPMTAPKAVEEVISADQINGFAAQVKKDPRVPAQVSQLIPDNTAQIVLPEVHKVLAAVSQ